jgi:hypothetical protein
MGVGFSDWMRGFLVLVVGCAFFFLEVVSQPEISLTCVCEKRTTTTNRATVAQN